MHRRLWAIIEVLLTFSCMKLIFNKGNLGPFIKKTTKSYVQISKKVIKSWEISPCTIRYWNRTKGSNTYPPIIQWNFPIKRIKARGHISIGERIFKNSSCRFGSPTIFEMDSTALLDWIPFSKQHLLSGFDPNIKTLLSSSYAAFNS